jgi:hypothetical protein
VEDVLDDKQHRFGVAAQVAAPAACVQIDAEPALEYYALDLTAESGGGQQGSKKKRQIVFFVSQPGRTGE